MYHMSIWEQGATEPRRLSVECGSLSVIFLLAMFVSVARAVALSSRSPVRVFLSYTQTN